MTLEKNVSMFTVLMTGMCVENTRKLIEAKRREFLKLTGMCSFKTGEFCPSMFSQH